jgi:small subunit ribosomal protein S17
MSEETQPEEAVEEVVAAAEETLEEAAVEEVAEVVEAPAEAAPAAKVPAKAAPAVKAAKVVAAPVAEDDESRANRKVREGIVVSDKMEATAVVAIIERVRHPKYAKFVNRTKRLYAHDVSEERAHIGDKVRIMETRPLSKLKRWRVVEILERAK